jgi:hypothetical protein
MTEEKDDRNNGEEEGSELRYQQLHHTYRPAGIY